jgi:hypothetical protein
MEKRMVASKPTWVGTMNQDGNGQAIQSLMASEQFSTRDCARCAGLLVNDWSYDLENTGEHVSAVLRCVQCGHRVDPVILQNQIHRCSKASATSGCTVVLERAVLVGDDACSARTNKHGYETS